MIHDGFSQQVDVVGGFEALAKAERLHREFFRPAASRSELPAWEPPVDVLETERAVLVLWHCRGSIRTGSRR